jgi:hypothetical protein
VRERERERFVSSTRVVSCSSVVLISFAATKHMSLIGSMMSLIDSMILLFLMHQSFIVGTIISDDDDDAMHFFVVVVVVVVVVFSFAFA